MNKVGKELLILYIDVDDDLGKCGIETPIIGIENVVKSAYTFALCKPTDSDLNALFKAIKIYYDLAKNHRVEIALVSGASQEPSYISMVRFAEKLEAIRHMLSIDKAIVVFDSIEDERAIPVVAQYFSIVGLENVVVEQSRSIETFYTILVKLSKKIASEKTYARTVLGYPGFALLILTILSLYNLTYLAVYAILLFISLAMIVKGFGLSSYFKEFSKRPLKLITIALMIFLLSISAYLTYTQAIDMLTAGYSIVPAIALSIQRYAHLILLALAIPLISKILISIHEHNAPSIIFYIALLSNLLLSYVLIQNATLILSGAREARIFAITNSLVVIIAMIIITAVSELVIKRSQ